MTRPIIKACPLTHHLWGENKDLKLEDCDVVEEVMPDIQQKLDAGLVLLIEIKEPEGLSPDGDVVQLNSAVTERTGRMAFVSTTTVEALFGKGHDEVKTAFVNQEIMDGLEMMAEKMQEAQAKQDDSVEFEELENE